MRYGDDTRIAQLERSVELLAAMLGTTCEELETSWPQHQERKTLLAAQAKDAPT